MGRKILSGVIVLAILCTAGIMGYSYFTIKYGIKYERTWNHCVSIVTYNDRRCGVRNNSTGKIVGRFDEVMPYSDPSDVETTALIVVKDGLRGYVSAVTGEIIFPPQFLYAWIDNAENNLAACVNSEQKLGFVNVKTKEIAIPFQYEFDGDILVPDGEPLFDFVFHNGLCIIPGENGNLGLIDENGNQLLPTEYSDIIDWRTNLPIIILERKDNDGCILYSTCDRMFNMLLTLEYDSLYKCYSDIEEPIYIASRNGKYGILDSLLKEILPFKFDDIDRTDYNDAYIVQIDGKYGVLNESFDIIIPIDYEHIEERYIGDDCGCGYVAVTNYTQKLFNSEGVLLNDFYVDTHEEYDPELDSRIARPGLEVVPEPFNRTASPYIKYLLDDCWGIIDGRTREVVVPARYDKIEYLGLGNFACILDDKTYLITDNKRL